MTKILITGSKGMLAYDLMPILQQQYEVVWYDRGLLDITNAENIIEILDNEQPDIVINCAAYTDVDAAESEWKLLNYQVNTLGIYLLAKICFQKNIYLLHISTDYVFDGTKELGYLPQDITNPINQYGMAKYLWEFFLFSEHPHWIIIRTSWLFGWGYQFKNFVNTMISLADKNKPLKVVGDQFGCPTYTKDLSYAILDVVNDIQNYKWTILHFCNQTDWKWITWYDFAQEIFHLLSKNVVCDKCTSEEFKTKAIRPHYSKLINDSKIVLRDWKIWLKEYLSKL